MVLCLVVDDCMRTKPLPAARIADSVACPADGQLAGLVQYLQKRLRTLEGENTSLEQVVNRQKVDIEATARRASQAEQARLETAEQLRNSLRTQEQHDRQMQQVQELNLLRESNVTLRSALRSTSMSGKRVGIYLPGTCLPCAACIQALVCACMRLLLISRGRALKSYDTVCAAMRPALTQLCHPMTTQPCQRFASGCCC